MIDTSLQQGVRRYQAGIRQRKAFSQNGQETEGPERERGRGRGASGRPPDDAAIYPRDAAGV